MRVCVCVCHTRTGNLVANALASPGLEQIPGSHPAEARADEAPAREPGAQVQGLVGAQAHRRAAH